MKKILKVVITFFIMSISFGCSNKVVNDRILYSWHMENISDINLINTIKKLNINILYQDFSNDYLNSNDSIFLEEMEKNNIKVYHLCGDPSWAVNGSNKIIKEIDKVINYNKKNKHRINGIVLDIESYILDSYNEDEYIKIIKNAYKYCKENNIYMVLCIPTWMKKRTLEELISNSDEVSVMDYNIRKTILNIKEEVLVAKKYNKKINTVYEINFDNIKCFSSFNEIENDYQKIINNYDYPISIAFHHYNSIDKLAKNNN